MGEVLANIEDIGDTESEAVEFLGAQNGDIESAAGEDLDNEGARVFAESESLDNEGGSEIEGAGAQQGAVLYHIKDFDGPLDLLLALIKDSKLDIKAVRLSEITGQYLKYLDDVGSLDLNSAGEFIDVGATLAWIKAKQILPQEKAEEEKDEEDPEVKLKRQLEEYKILKEASEKLAPLETVGRFYKPAVPIKEKINWTLDNVGTDALMEAFAKVITKLGERPVKITEAKLKMDRFTVAEKIAEISATLGDKEELSFFELFEGDFTKSEVINTFLAILELLKHQIIRACQNEKFKDIILIRGESFGEKIGGGEFEGQA
ncbi:MAG: segregation/condensation protein A [Christensenellaceae bacterium]|jgi:segregation and condensation protein A|nr:segregation/condensation protein A [Christensenellaceae bacterium]